MASPLPSTWPNSGSRSASWCTSAPSAAAISAVPSPDAASTTSTWSISPSSASSRSTIGPIVSATSRVGSTTVTGSRLRSRSSSGGNCEWWKGRIKPFVLWQAVSQVQAQYPWEAVLETAAEGEVVATVRERAQDGRDDAAAGGPPPRSARSALRPPGSRRSGPTRRTRWRAPGAGHTIVTTGTASGKSLAFNLPVLDTLASDPLGARVLPLPDQGARPGPGPQAVRARRRGSCATRSTTATRRARSGARSASAPT